ncbi:MAG: sulfatase [Verrucomicrobiales bacterium]|nr:sulfatase [Verrucomicrobiales bacterium]
MSFRLFLVLCFLVLLAEPSIKAGSKSKPNIVFFLADDLGWTGLRSFGSDFYETPNLDLLAKEGMKFTDAYAACTVCSPTRASILTGQYPARLNLTSFIPGQERPFAKMEIPDWTKGLQKSETTLSEALKTSGYKTLHIGKWHLEFPNRPDDGPMMHGFDFSADKPPGSKGFFLSGKTQKELKTEQGYLTDYLADLAVQKIGENKDAPFFLYFAFHVPHTPIQGRADLVTDFEAKVYPEAIHRNPTYAAMVKSMDLAVGRVITALEENGIADNTMIVFTSDNGGLTQRYGKHDEFTENLPLRRGKGSAYEGGVRVPTIVKWPGCTIPGSVSKEPISSIDWMPTFLDVADFETEESLAKVIDGVSLVPLLEQKNEFPERDIFWHFPHYHAGGDGPYSAIRSGDWKLIERHEGTILELYDLGSDPGETKNLSTTNTAKAHELQDKLAIWREEVEAQMTIPNPDFDAERELELRRRK